MTELKIAEHVIGAQNQNQIHDSCFGGIFFEDTTVYIRDVRTLRSRLTRQVTSVDGSSVTAASASTFYGCRPAAASASGARPDENASRLYADSSESVGILHVIAVHFEVEWANVIIESFPTCAARGKDP